MTTHPPLSVHLTRTDDELVQRFSVLSSRQDVAALLEIPDRLLVRILYLRRDPQRYCHFEVRKRDPSRTRRISVPPPALGIIQGKLNKILQLAYKRRGPVHGFVTGRSILTNAIEHVARRWVLNIDLENFFPTINFGRVRGMFMAPPYRVSPPAATVLAQICCADNALPQGAPTSPIVSNMVCGRLDGELLALARRYRCRYSRYGDDLTFSTRQRDFPAALAEVGDSWIGDHVRVGPALAGAIESNGFRVNGSKTRLQFQDCHQEVTGITVNEFPNIPRALVREIRSMIHAWRRHGLEAAERRFHEHYAWRDRRPGSPPPSYASVLKGKLEFLRMVRGPEDHIYRKLRSQLHSLDPDLIPDVPEQAVVVPQDAMRARTGLIWTEYYRQFGDLVAHVQLKNTAGETLAGTAWAYRSTVLATAAHNVSDTTTVHLPDGARRIEASVVHDLAAEGADCALIRLSDSIRRDRGYLPMDPRIPQPGEPVAVIGYLTVPRRHPELAITRGYVEAVSQDYARRITYMQLNIQSAGGLSGAPVINRAGRVIGIVVESTFEQVGEAVPGREFCQVLPISYVNGLNLDRLYAASHRSA